MWRWVVLSVVVVPGLVLACSEGAGESARESERVMPASGSPTDRCEVSPGYAPTPAPGDPCTVAGLECNQYTCVSGRWRRTHGCPMEAPSLGSACEVEPSYPCNYPDRCPGSLPGESAYRGYRCDDGGWVDLSAATYPCADDVRDAAAD